MCVNATPLEAVAGFLPSLGRGFDQEGVRTRRQAWL
jgi:hypothetical protein